MPPKRPLAALAAQAAALPEPAMRLDLGLRLLAAGPADQAAALLAEALAAQRRGSALLTLLDALTQALPRLTYERVSELYAAAKEAEQLEVCALLTGPGLGHAPEAPARSGLDPQMAEVSLGRRKWLARKPDHTLVARLLHDPDPAVIRNLLHNPRLTLAQVVRIAAKRPAPASVLAELAGHPRWQRRYEVRRALVLNPHTPSDLSARLAATLLEQDLVLLSSEPSIPAELRDLARRLLLVRRRPAADAGGPPDAT